MAADDAGTVCFHLRDVEEGRMTRMEVEAAQGQVVVLACPRGHAQLSPTCQQPDLHRAPAPAVPAGAPPDLCGCRGFICSVGPVLPPAPT